ncbi:MAG TPA: hypothetical protein VJA94_00505 [Candidatus Angelobacter sp.]
MRRVLSSTVPGPPRRFDIPYDRKLHHRAVLEEIRNLVTQKGSRFNLRKPRIVQPWLDATLRDAPMLKGFFADEPKWRDKLLRWCAKALQG